MSETTAQLRVVFAGSPVFAVPSLEALLSSPEIDVPLVVTQPDRPSGRGRKLRPPAVKVSAEAHGIPVFQPETLRDEAAFSRLEAAEPDVIVVVSYGEILTRKVLELPAHGCLNVHPSLLPVYRGSLPIQAPILNGDPETGVSIIKLVRRMDAGPIVYQEPYPLNGHETAGDLGKTLAELAASRLPGVVLRWGRGEITPVEQDESRASYTRELTRADAEVDWEWSGEYIERFVRAMYPWTRAWSTIRENRLTINQVTLANAQEAAGYPPGTVMMGSNGVMVSAGDGVVVLEQVQPAGKNSMHAVDWLRGMQTTEPMRFDPANSERDPLIFTRE